MTETNPPQIKCPKCGKVQSFSETCIGCGLLFRKYVEVQKKRQLVQQEKEKNSKNESLPEKVPVESPSKPSFVGKLFQFLQNKSGSPDGRKKACQYCDKEILWGAIECPYCKNEQLRHMLKSKTGKPLPHLSQLAMKYDDIMGVAFYTSHLVRHNNDKNMASIYIVSQPDGAWLRLKMSYLGSNWIFFDQAFLHYDGTTVQIHFDPNQDKLTENDSQVWEWIDLIVGADMVPFFMALAQSKIAKMRLSGKYSVTRELSKQEKTAFGQVANGFLELFNSNTEDQQKTNSSEKT